MHDIDLLELAEKVGEDFPMDFKYQVYDETARFREVLRIGLNAQYVDGSEQPVTGEVTVTPEIVTDSNINPLELLEGQIQKTHRSVIENSSDKIEVNGHEIQIQMTHGFRATCLDTGVELSVQPEEYKHTPPATLHVDGVDEALTVTDATVFDDSRDLPYHIKEKLLMYVVGWAMEYSPDEWFNQHSGELLVKSTEGRRKI